MNVDPGFLEFPFASDLWITLLRYLAVVIGQCPWTWAPDIDEKATRNSFNPKQTTIHLVLISLAAHCASELSICRSVAGSKWIYSPANSVPSGTDTVVLRYARPLDPRVLFDSCTITSTTTPSHNLPYGALSIWLSEVDARGETRDGAHTPCRLPNAA